MFVEVTAEIAHLLEHPNDRVFRNNFVPEGQSSEAQFLRYKAGTGEWEIELRAGFASFKAVLQQHQAQALIDGSGMHHKYRLSVINHEIRQV